ncbi:MAG: YCF48-related protein, partial [Candidatus Poribacteria bacterium]|nr:YCF48-related protein [Candidatus Poribacteria bacterium]
MKNASKRIHHFMVITTILATLLIGCTTEVARKADWETHFTDLHFTDALRGWIVGLEGLIVHTNDGGKTWRRQEVETNGDFKAIYFTNRKYGWAVGDEGLIAATDDGGKHWHLQKSGTSAMLRDIFFVNSK